MTVRRYVAERIWTMDRKQPYVRCMAVDRGRVVAVGAEAQAMPCEEVVNLGSGIVLPGLIDAHVHFGDLARAKWEVDLRGTSSLEAALERLAARATGTWRTEWLFARGWDESKWPEARYLTRADLDRVAPDVPLVARRICGHLWVANSKALELGGVPADAPGLDAEQGWLREGATIYLKPHREPLPERLAESMRAASTATLRLGITSVHDQWSELGPLLKAGPNALRVKVRVGVPDTKLDALCELGLPTGFGNPRVRLGGVKVFADGSVGAQTAALHEPYADDPSATGMFVHEPEELVEIFTKAHRAGLQIAAHAIGDRGIDLVVDSLRKAVGAGSARSCRHRIEHCELPRREAVEAMELMGVIASVQPNFIGEWGLEGGMYRRRLGSPRWRSMNPLGTLQRAGIRMAFGSDGMPIGPLYGIWSATQHPVPEERLTPEQAVRCYTTGSAYAGFEEDEKGKLLPGYAADFVVLSADPALVPKSQIRDIQVLKTFVDGECAFTAQPS